jgi:hypothetical protein
LGTAHQEFRASENLRVFLALRLSLSIVCLRAKRIESLKMVNPAKTSQSCQRVSVQLERHVAGKQAKVSLESYDQVLGWYTSGSVTIPIQQLALLEQAIEEMRAAERDEKYEKIIPFPGVSAPHADSAVAEQSVVVS